MQIGNKNPPRKLFKLNMIDTVYTLQLTACAGYVGSNTFHHAGYSFLQEEWELKFKMDRNKDSTLEPVVIHWQNMGHFKVLGCMLKCLKIKGIVSDSDYIFLWHKSEDINKNRL